MKVIWLVEDFAQDNRIHEFADELKEIGCDVRMVDYTSVYQSKSKGFDIPDDECVAFQGSIQLAAWIERHKKWVPGPWLQNEKFKCTHYYSFLGKYLLNADYVFTTKGEYERRREEYFKVLGVADALFIRPNTGMKSFSGNVFCKEKHESDWMFFNQFIALDDIMIVASPKKIQKEYRFVVHNGVPIAASQYHNEGKLELVEGAPHSAWALAREIGEECIKNGMPRMLCIDIAESNDEFYLMELNSFTCAGLYACKKHIVAIHATAEAITEWKEYHDVK